MIEQAVRTDPHTYGAQLVVPWRPCKIMRVRCARPMELLTAAHYALICHSKYTNPTATAATTTRCMNILLPILEYEDRFDAGNRRSIYGYREMSFHATHFKIFNRTASVRPRIQMVWHDNQTGSTMQTMPVTPCCHHQTQRSHRRLHTSPSMRGTITSGRFVIGLLAWILTASGLQHDPAIADQPPPVGLWHNSDDRTAAHGNLHYRAGGGAHWTS